MKIKLYGARYWIAALLLSALLFCLFSCVEYVPRPTDTETSETESEETSRPTVVLPFPDDTSGGTDTDADGFPNEPEPDGTKRY